MNFLTPLNLLFLLLIPVIILLYLLKLRRKEVVVSSNLLWQPIIQDLQANAPLQKLKKNLLMFLQIAIAAVLAFALARPFLNVRALRGENIVLVLDASASMKAQDVAPSRFEAAKRQAARMVDDLSVGDKMLIVEAAARTRVLSPFTSDKRALHARLAAAEPKDTTSNLREAIVLALSLIKGKPDSTLYILSDGAVGPITDLHLGNVQVEYLKFGRRADNVALTALDIRRGFTRGYNYQIFVNLRNFSNRRRTVDLELLRGDQLFAVRTLALPASGSRSEVFQDIGFDSGLVTARINAKDDLSSDDVAYASLAPRRSVSVLLLSTAGFFLENALNVDTSVRLFRAKPSAYPTPTRYDVYVFDNFTPSSLPKAPVLLVHSSPPDGPVTASGSVQNPTIVDWNRKHPVTQFLNFADVQIASALGARLKPWAKALVESARFPLVAVGERGQRRMVYVGFDFAESDMPLRVAFPIFISNCLRWLTASGKVSEESEQYRTGDLVLLRAPASLPEVAVKGSQGKTHKVLPANGQFLFDDTDQVGVYHAKAKGYTHTFAVSLLNPRESDTHPRSSLALGQATVTLARAGARANREIWRWIVLLALGVLCFEWWVYHRGGL